MRRAVLLIIEDGAPEGCFADLDTATMDGPNRLCCVEVAMQNAAQFLGVDPFALQTFRPNQVRIIDAAISKGLGGAAGERLARRPITEVFRALDLSDDEAERGLQ